MILKGATYDETLDFDVLSKELTAMPEGESALRDLSEISEEDINFFKKLVSANQISALGGFDTDTVIRNVEALFNSQTLLQFVENLTADGTILSDCERLMKAITQRRLPIIRRLL